MAIQLFNEEEDISLKEYSEDPNYEDYAGIVLDKDKNQFKVVTGKFTDKKDFYEKMSNRGLILRKCFEIRVYNWIKENARTTLDAYLMLSTAFSKWKGNNMLSGYYNKLLKDIPELNREGQKGNPNTRGKEESTIDEAVGLDPNFNCEALSSDEIKALFANTSLNKEYIDALAEKDTVTSMTKLYNAQALISPLNKFKFTGGTWKNKNYLINNEIERQMRASDYVRSDRRIDTDAIASRKVDYTIDSAPKYTVILTPVFGKVEDVKIHPHVKTATTVDKVVPWLYPETRDTSLRKILSGVRIPNYGNVDGLKNELGNPEIYQEIYRLYTLASHEGTDDNKFLGLIVNVKDQRSGADVTDQLLKSAQKNKNALVDVYDLDGNEIANGVLPANAGMKEDGFFIDRSIISGWIRKLNSDSRYSLNPYTIQQDKLKTFKGLSNEQNLPSGISELYHNFYIQKDALEKEGANIQEIDTYRKQKTFIDYKGKEFLHFANNEDPKLERLAKSDLSILKTVIAPTLLNDYDNAMKEYTPAGKQLLSYEARLQNNEYKSIANNLQVGKVNQNASVIDKLMRIKDAEETLVLNKKGKLTKKKTTKKQKEKPAEVSKQDRLLNNISRLKNAVKYWEYRATNARGKDRDEAEDQMSKNNKALLKALSDYKKYIEENPSPEVSAPINPNATGELNVEEAYVNDGATGYFLDQQNAAKNALKGQFITEEMTHSELNQKLFDGEVLKPDVRDAFLEIADKFKQTLKIAIDPVDVYFTGSNANYNYNESSDIDLHLVYDFERVGIAADILEKYLRDAKRLFNLDYDGVTVKGIKVEVGYENIATPLVATAVYSLRNNDWVKKPEVKAIEISDPDQDQYNELVSNIETAIQDKDLNALEALWKEIGELRKQSLNLEGEFGKGNALFKKLRNLGTIGRLRNAYYDAASKELSLESNGANVNE